mgnify:CR=1 FL=1
MAKGFGSRTFDGAGTLRCMVVGLTPEGEESCRRAILPVEVVPARNAEEACASMSTLLPLVVVVDPAVAETERSSISEMATACGAEVVTFEPSAPGPSLAARLLEAVRVAERRRLGNR